MSYILQVDFPYAGPWGHEMTEAMDVLARSIAEAYLTMHTARLKGLGIPHVNGKIFAVNEALSQINRGPV